MSTVRRRFPALRRALLAAAMVTGSLAVAAQPAAGRSEIAAIAAANGRSEAQMTRILADRAARVGARNRVYYVEPLASETDSTVDEPAAGSFPASETFRLHSRPGSSRVIYLDFDGHTVSGTAWNDDPDFGTASSFEAAPYSQDADPAFAGAELDAIQSVWQKVSEDFAVFDVDVTTQDPGQAAITRDGVGDGVYGTRALVTNTSLGCGCAGMAYLDIFDDAFSYEYFQPAFVFNRLGVSAKDLAEVASHEVGHNLGLEHDGRSEPAEDYYGGHDAWGPIMGAPYGRPITHWSRGEYGGANNAQDDIAIIGSNGAPLLSDDVGDIAAAATELLPASTVTATGVITTAADVDVFRVSAGSGTAAVSVSPSLNGPNLDIELELRNEAGSVLASSKPPSGYLTTELASGLAASVSLSLLSAGDYYLFVSGSGSGDLTTGYSGYSSLGPYTLTASLPLPPASVTIAASPTAVLTGEPFTVTATASLDVGPTAYSIQVLEDGVVRLSCDTGTSCAYTASSPTAGTRTFSARISEADGSSVQASSGSASVTVGAVSSPAFTSSAPPSLVSIGVAYSHTFAATGNPAPTFAVTSGALPTGLSLDGATGRLSGTPTVIGSFSFTVTADNGVDPDAHSTVTVTVTEKAGYWMLAADGTVYAFGDVRHFGSGTTGAVDIEPTPSGSGYWVIQGNGVLSAHGDAPHLGDRPRLLAGEAVASISATPDGGGYWLFTSRGRVFAYGTAPHFGDLAAVTLNGPVLDSTSTPSGRGYYMVASDGGIFAFGDAGFAGSMGGAVLNAPVMSLAPDPDGAGYWLVASDGGVFAFEAPFVGSLGGLQLNRPISGMVASGGGYLMVGEDGGIFAFGPGTRFQGSLGDNPPPTPVVAVAAL